MRISWSMRNEGSDFGPSDFYSVFEMTAIRLLLDYSRKTLVYYYLHALGFQMNFVREKLVK